MKNCRSRDCRGQNTYRLQQREVSLQDPVLSSFHLLNLNLWAGVLLVGYHLEAISLPSSDNVLVKVDQSICRTCVFGTEKPLLWISSILTLFYWKVLWLLSLGQGAEILSQISPAVKDVYFVGKLPKFSWFKNLRLNAFNR